MAAKHQQTKMALFKRITTKTCALGWSVLYGKISNSKIEKSCSLKSCGHSLETTFVLRLFKILSADGRASASKIKKRPKKSIFFSILEISSKFEVQKLNVCACLTRLIKPDKKIITYNTLLRSLTRTLDQK
jgi:hypothetical protein